MDIGGGLEVWGTLCGVLGLLIAGAAVGAVAQPSAGGTEPRMTLAEISRALDENEAWVDAASFSLRTGVLEQLDEHLSAADSERSPEIIAYYRQRVEGTLDQIDTMQVNQGVVLWKLYSSGFVVKTPHTIFGVDLCEGPNEDMFGGAQVPFRLTDTQRQRLAGLVQYSFHTHHHYDHLSHALVAQMAQRGTPVYVTRQHAELWRDEPFATQLARLEPEGESLSIGPLQVRAYHGHQGSDECNAFLIRTGSGVGIWVKGDIYDGNEYAGILERLAGTGETMHLYVSSTWTKRGPDIIQETRSRFNPVFIPSHEWEFTHRSAGESGVATQSYGVNAAFFVGHEARTVILSWGDRLRFTPQP